MTINPADPNYYSFSGPTGTVILSIDEADMVARDMSIWVCEARRIARNEPPLLPWGRHTVLNPKPHVSPVQPVPAVRVRTRTRTSP